MVWLCESKGKKTITRNKPLYVGWGGWQCDTTARAIFELVLSVYCAKALLIANSNKLFPFVAGQQHSIASPPSSSSPSGRTVVSARGETTRNIVSVVDRSGSFLLQPQLYENGITNPSILSYQLYGSRFDFHGLDVLIFYSMLTVWTATGNSMLSLEARSLLTGGLCSQGKRGKVEI